MKPLSEYTFQTISKLYTDFLKHKTEIAAALGVAENDIEWKDASKATRFYLKKNFDMTDSSQWIEIFKWYIENCLAIKKVIPSII